MSAVFVELPPFARSRQSYLADDEFRKLQLMLMSNPTCGAVIRGTGGLRKVRFSDDRRQKGKRGGVRIIYYFWLEGSQFWLFTIYDKGEADDLTPAERKIAKTLLEAELAARNPK